MSETKYALSQLKRLRLWRRLTQAQLADLSGIKISTIQKHERGVQKSAALDVAAPLAHALQVPIEALFSVGVSSKLLEKNSAPLLAMSIPPTGETP